MALANLVANHTLPYAVDERLNDGQGHVSLEQSKPDLAERVVGEEVGKRLSPSSVTSSL